jgi:hypothetical protein
VHNFSLLALHDKGAAPLALAAAGASGQAASLRLANQENGAIIRLSFSGIKRRRRKSPLLSGLECFAALSTLHKFSKPFHP